MGIYGICKNELILKIAEMLLHFGNFPLFCVEARAVSAKQERDAPQPRKTDNRINNSAEDRGLTAEDPCYKIELKQADKSPVDRTDDR